MSFSDLDEDMLINLVAKHPILYDPTQAEYRSVLAKENIWNVIGKELNKHSEDCKKKWKFMRDGYYRFKKRRKSGSAAPKNSKYKRHKQMSFLDPYNPRGPDFPASPAQVEIEENTDTNQEQSEEQLQYDDMLNTPETIIIKKELPDDNLNEQSDQSQKLSRLKREIVKKMWKGRDKKRQCLLKPKLKKKDDDVKLFCRHIAEVLRNLPPVYKAEAKKEIGVLISDYEIKAARSKSKPRFTYVKSRETNALSTASSSSLSQYSSN